MQGRVLLSMSVCVGAVLLAGGVVLALDETPVFLDWLKPSDPEDQTIRVYWERVAAGEATAVEMVDLGTMLFHRGYPKDAVRLFKEALDLDPDLAEAWFRIGIVRHHAGDLAKARRAYRKCLKKFPGHGWCNFYLGWCEEQLGDAGEALHYYRRAFRFAPELADPTVNPLVLHSDLQPGLSALLERQQRFRREAPLSFLEADKVARVRQSFQPAPTPTPEPAARPVVKRAPASPGPGPTPIVRRPRSDVEAARPTPSPSPTAVTEHSEKAPETRRTLQRRRHPPGSGPVPRNLRPVPVQPAPSPSPAPSPTPEGDVN